MGRSLTPSGARRGRQRRLLGILAMGMLLSIVAGMALVTGRGSPATVDAAGCRIYVASGDDIAAGKDLDDNSKRYPEQLVEDHIKTPGWCLFNQAKNGQSSSSYINEGGLSSAYNMRPDLLTLQLGEQNTTIVNLVDTCFDLLKRHEFAAANGCAAAILANQALWDDLRKNYTTILQYTRIMRFQRPNLVVAVVNYPNPYPDAKTAATKIGSLCSPLQDTTITCLTRWSQLPGALITLDQVFQKMNTTLKDSLAPFQQVANGNRWVYVDVYPKLRSHCMKMEVQIRTTVVHPEQQGVTHQHDSQKVNFGCNDPWFTAGSVGTANPYYLIPATPGVLVNWSQTTEGMGVYPDADGHQCIADAIWEADTIDPGTTPLKWKLGYGEAADPNICS